MCLDIHIYTHLCIIYMYTYIDRNICFEPVCSEMWPYLAPLLPGQDASLTMCCGGGERWGMGAALFNNGRKGWWPSSGESQGIKKRRKTRASYLYEAFVHEPKTNEATRIEIKIPKKRDHPLEVKTNRKAS